MEPQQQQQHAPGGHYSGHNPIPTVRQFVENLDKDKAARDKKLDEEARQQKQQQSQPHKQSKRQVEGTEKTVTDPTTGREVTIADVNKDMIDEVENPHLVVPNANLNKQTVCQLLRLSAYLLINTL
jgi:tRNA(Glu) U13 pseudouridine synthase TruD